MILKKLRRAIVSHLDLPKTSKRQLEGTRRQEFADIAAEVINEAQPDAPEKPDWLTLEDEDAITAVYLVTFAAVLDDTAAAATTLESWRR